VTDRASESRLYRNTLTLAAAQAVGASPGRYNFLEGRAVPYDTWQDVGWFMERHAAGSFERSTKAGSGRQLPLLLFHDNTAFPVGHAEQWSHDGGGLDGVWRLNDSPEAQRAAALADAGDLTGLSIGFQPIRTDRAYVDEWDPELGPDHKDRYTRLESRLLEVSLTPTPAFADAEVTLVRSAFDAQQRAAMRPERVAEVDRWRATVDTLRSR
jgi:HK97 family phage prohead protease